MIKATVLRQPDDFCPPMRKARRIQRIYNAVSGMSGYLNGFDVCFTHSCMVVMWVCVTSSGLGAVLPYISCIPFIILPTCSFSCSFPLSITYSHRSYEILVRVALEVHQALRSSFVFDYEELIGLKQKSFCKTVKPWDLDTLTYFLSGFLQLLKVKLQNK